MTNCIEETIGQILELNKLAFATYSHSQIIWIKKDCAAIALRRYDT